MALLHHDDAKIDRLKTIPLFEHADKTALQHLASAADEATVKPGTVLIGQGHLHAEGYIIVSGTASVFVDDVEVAEIPENEIIGELSLFGQHIASATVKAKTELSVLSIPYNRFDQIMTDNPNLTKAIAKQLAGRLQSMDERIRS